MISRDINLIDPSSNRFHLFSFMFSFDVSTHCLLIFCKILKIGVEWCDKKCRKWSTSYMAFHNNYFNPDSWPIYFHFSNLPDTNFTYANANKHIFNPVAPIFSEFKPILNFTSFIDYFDLDFHKISYKFYEIPNLPESDFT